MTMKERLGASLLSELLNIFLMFEYPCSWDISHSQHIVNRIAGLEITH